MSDGSSARLAASAAPPPPVSYRSNPAVRLARFSRNLCSDGHEREQGPTNEHPEPCRAVRALLRSGDVR